MGRVRHFEDGHRHCVEIERPGEAPELHVYVDRRAGLTFPTMHNPGYYCVFGVKDMPSMTDRLPMQLLAEDQTESMDTLFKGLSAKMKTYNCAHVYADCSSEFQSAEIQLSRFLEKRNIRWLEMHDASEFDGFDATYAGFEAARAPIDELGRKGKLMIPKSGQSHLGTELANFMEENAKDKPYQKYPALNAFNHVIMSYVISPYERPADEALPDIEEGYGG